MNGIVRKAAESCGYKVFTGFQYRMQEEIMAFPAVWMLPVRLSGAEGRREGMLTYAVALYLMRLDRKHTAEEKERIWSDMELDALNIADRILAQNRVFVVENISTAPAERTLTHHGELSLKAEFEVKMSFCNDLIG